ncbi:Glyoxysomal fatty acid beta-oxidation multifunctional protein MFP-a [Capsicum baccatum]|uniref:Glyoxysomal fatty acid beta-oxidation multifunctional protein MFP-a n=1 Tax=Capsicum baccatum TaxID=33114 RepID=A0A2G2W5W1_CAPBA|nr:Glyoxysomal fatty acid beta-oxidation multifunctional protein MFP-a [Capsicum baccatum]
MLANEFKINECDKCVYIKDTPNHQVIVCLYVDVMLIISKDISDIDATKQILENKFDMKDLVVADVILGIGIHITPQGLALSQSHYIEKLLYKFKYMEFGIPKTPLDVSFALQKNKAIEELKRCYEEAIDNDNIKAIVLSGADGRFCGGLEISVVENVHKHGDISLLPDASIGLVVNKIENGKKPSVAAIQGFALGGGLELAMGCSARIATPKADLGLPELRLGVIPGCGGTQRLPRLVGTSKAVDMLMSSKSITSEEGKELGLIDAIVSSEELLTVARCWALDIVEGRQPNCNSLQKTDKLGTQDESLEILRSARQRYTVPHYRACLDVIEEGIISGGYSGVLKEDKVFKELVLSNTAKGLLHVFLAERATSKVPGVTDVGLKPRRIEKVAVIGGGLMGSGIATALIISNISVVLKEINHEYLLKAVKSVEENLQGFVTRGKLNQEKLKRTLSLLKGTLDFEDLKDVDMVIEAVNENVCLKQSIFEDIEKTCTSECIFASNTSTISLDVIGKRTSSQDRILGMHLFSPAHLMPLVEIVRTENTSPQVIVDVIKLTKILKKVPIVVKSCTGFAVNRSFFPYMQGPDLLANLGVDIFRIDRVITEFGMRLGPFQLQDVSGYGIFLAGVKEFAAAFPGRAFQSPLVQLMVENGREGKKNGKGYYTYNKGSKPEADHSVIEIVEESMQLTNIAPGGKPISVTDKEILEMIFFPVVNEACRVIEEGIVVRASDIDIASVHGFKFPSETGGIMFWADTIGSEYIYSKLKSWYEAYGDFFKPSTFLEQRAAEGLPLVRFWEALKEVVRGVPTSEKIVIAEDFNGHIGALPGGFGDVHGGFGFGDRNEEGTTLLEFARSFGLVVVNSGFLKKVGHLITFRSAIARTQIDFLLLRKGDRVLCKDCKVIRSENLSTQHRLLVMDLSIKKNRKRRSKEGRPRIKWGGLTPVKA